MCFFRKKQKNKKKHLKLQILTEQDCLLQELILGIASFLAHESQGIFLVGTFYNITPPKTKGWNLKIHPNGKGETFTSCQFWGSTC